MKPTKREDVYEFDSFQIKTSTTRTGEIFAVEIVQKAGSASNPMSMKECIPIRFPIQDVVNLRNALSDILADHTRILTETGSKTATEVSGQSIDEQDRN